MSELKVKARNNQKAKFGSLETLSEIRNNERYKCIKFRCIHFGGCKVEKVMHFFASDTRTWKELTFERCSGHVDAIITIALKSNIVESLILHSRWSKQLPKCGSPIIGLGLMLKVNTSLTSIDLRLQSMNRAEAKCLAHALKLNSTLKTIKLSLGVAYATRDYEGILLDLATGFEKNKYLESVYLDVDDDDETGGSCLIQALKGNPSLKKLTIHCGFCPDDALVDLLGSTQATIISLGLHVNVYEAHPLSQNIVDAIRGHGSIVSLDLHGSEISDPISVLLAGQLGFNSKLALQHLNLTGCGITGTGVTAIALALSSNSTLKKLNLDENAFGNPGATAIADALSENSTLQELCLRDNSLGGACIESFANALRRQNATLQILNLGSNDLGDDVDLLADALHHNSTLRDLDVSWNDISDAGAVALAGALMHNSGLLKLDIRDNPIELEGVRSIAKALRTNSMLNVLVLATRHPEEMKSLEAEILKENFHLEYFGPSLGGKYYEGSRKEIVHLMHFNRGGRKLLRAPKFPLGMWPFVLERADTTLYYDFHLEYRNLKVESEKPQLSVLYSLLREGPMLFSRPLFGRVESAVSTS
jgi:Ran GTPase-activating protein (RanGAP) involved in mRNA processing and transport